MKHLFLLLAFFLPSLSFASVVPPQFPVQFDGSYWQYTNFWRSEVSDFVCVADDTKLCADLVDSSYTIWARHVYKADEPYLFTGTSTFSDFHFGGGYSGSPQDIAGYSGAITVLASTTPALVDAMFPGPDYVFVNFFACGGVGCNSTASSTLIGYSKWRYNGTNWVDSLGAGASGSWTFSTSTSVLPIDFSDFAQGLKDAMVNNTFQPVCPVLADVFDLVVLGTGEWWQDCFLPTIVNFLFVPSPSAIDYMLSQMTDSGQYGSSFAYMLIMPIASAVSVTACDLDDVSSCSVGVPLTLPVLDVYGSSTPWVLDPVSPLPSYFDDWLSAIVAVLILAGVSRVVLHKFL